MITLSKSGNAVKFTFDENDHYLQNGTIEVPVNSLALIMDDSDMVTFRKSASNDIFVSANYSEFGMSKAELEAWYKTYMVGSSGGGGGTGGTTPEEVQDMIDASLIPYSTTSEVDSMIDESVSGKADTSAVDALNNTVTAHTADTTIHVTANEKAAWNNKSDFSGDYNDLTNKPTIPTVPTSNTAFTNDAGYITSSALNGYATEDYVTASTSTKLDVSTFETYSGNVESALNGKQPIGDYVTGSQMSAFTYDKATIDEKISEGGIFDPTQYYTTAQTYSKTETNSLLDEKLDATAYTPTDLSNYDTKSEVNTKIEQATSGKVDTSTFNTYSGNVASALDGKVDDAEIADMATKTWVGNQGYLTEHQDISGKLDVSAFTAYSGAVDTTINSKASQASVDALNGVVSAHTANTEIHVTSAEKNAWNAKSDFSGSYNDLTDKPTIPTVPTSNTAFTNDARYITIDAISGKVDTSIYTAYTAATDTALDDKVNVADNEVPDYSVTNEITYQGGYPSQSETASTWNDASMFTLRYNFVRISDTNYTTTAAVIDPSRNITTGSVVTDEYRIGNPLQDYIDMTSVGDDITKVYSFTAKEGYRIAHFDIYSSRYGRYGAIIEERVETVFEGGQSADVIKDVIEPTLINKQDQLIAGENITISGNVISSIGGGSSYTAGTGIDITNDVISVTGKVDTTTYNTYTAATDTALATKADTATTYTKTEVDNAITAATSTKQDTLIAGENITISGNVISATSGGGGGMTEYDELLLATALTDLNDRKIDASEVKSNYQNKGDYATKDYVATALEPYETKLDEINTEEVTAYALNELNERLIALETAVQALQALHNNE